MATMGTIDSAAEMEMIFLKAAKEMTHCQEMLDVMRFMVAMETTG